MKIDPDGQRFRYPGTQACEMAACSLLDLYDKLAACNDSEWVAWCRATVEDDIEALMYQMEFACGEDHQGIAICHDLGMCRGAAEVICGVSIVADSGEQADDPIRPFSSVNTIDSFEQAVDTLPVGDKSPFVLLPAQRTMGTLTKGSIGD